jgi:hypothetical protein
MHIDIWFQALVRVYTYEIHNTDEADLLTDQESNYLLRARGVEEHIKGNLIESSKLELKYIYTRHYMYS